jgi:hypothetical protein
MSDFVWTEELTGIALKNLEHSTWGVINPNDMLRAIEYIHRLGGGASSNEINELRESLGIKGNDFRQNLKHLGLVAVRADKAWEITIEPSQMGFYSGKNLAEIVAGLGIDSPQALSILGHNFILHARESLPFCCRLMDPGVPESYLREELVDHYIFNQKLNSFKFPNLIKNLTRFQVIKETEFGLLVKEAPPALTFYQITSAYLFLASYAVGRKVKSVDLQREVHNLLPRRREDYTVLGFERFPIEGWGKHQAWMSPESFKRLLEVGVVDPLCVARVLQQVTKDKLNPSCNLAEVALGQLLHKIKDDVKPYDGVPVDLSEVLDEFRVV